MFSSRKSILFAVLAAAVGVSGFFAWQHFYPVTAAPGWTVKVYLDDVAMVTALARDDKGVLYIAHGQHKRRGSLDKQLPDGKIIEVMKDLDKPTGLARFRDGLLISQEGGEYPLLWLHDDGRIDKLFQGKNIEEIAVGQRFIYVVEDVKVDGRLLQYDPATGNTSVLRTGLVEAEAVAICPDGRLFYSESKKGVVKLYQNGLTEDSVVHGGLRVPGFLLCNQEGLWISEDATHQARVLLSVAGGTPEPVLKHLRSSQSVLSIAPGRLLVAEQGRNRILEVTRIPDGSK